MQQRTAYGSFTSQGSVSIPLNVNIKCLWCFLSDPQEVPEAFFCCFTKTLTLNSKTMFLHPSINIHQRIKLEGGSMWACVSVCLVCADSTSRSNHLCVWEYPACVCACIQKAPFGMNYLEESLFYLCTVHWPRVRKVLLPTSQETTLIHHPPFCSMPPSHPPNPA